MRVVCAGLVALGCSVGAGGAQAQAVRPRVIYDCHMSMRQGLVPGRIFLLEMPAPQQVEVWDGLVKATAGKPMPVTVEEDTPQHLRLKWVIHGLHGSTTRGESDQVDIAYTAVYVRGGALTMTAEILGGYANPLAQGSGSCTQK